MTASIRRTSEEIQHWWEPLEKAAFRAGKRGGRAPSSSLEGDEGAKGACYRTVWGAFHRRCSQPEETLGGIRIKPGKGGLEAERRTPALAEDGEGPTPVFAYTEISEGVDETIDRLRLRLFYGIFRRSLRRTVVGEGRARVNGVQYGAA